MRQLLMALLAVGALALSASDGRAADFSPSLHFKAPSPVAKRCAGGACEVLRRGRIRGRIHVPCVPIPFVKEGWGEVAMFVLRDFDVEEALASDEGLQWQLEFAIRTDSKITGPLDDFCRGAWFFDGGYWVVFCDEDGHFGWITGYALQYAVRYKRPLGRVPIGSKFVR